MTREQVLGLLVDVMLQVPATGPLRVGIDGRFGAGKTRMGDELADRLESKGRECHRASLEEFHPPEHHQRVASGALSPADYLKTGYDYAAVRRLLMDPIGSGGDRRCRLDFWNSHDNEPFPEDWVKVSDDAIVIVDGAFLLTPELCDLWDFTLWLDIDWQVMKRRAARRASEVDSGGAPAASEESEWMPRHVLYEQQVRPHERVDVIVDNSDLAHPYVVRMKSSVMPRQAGTTK